MSERGAKYHARQPMSEYARLPCFLLFAASSLPPFLAGRLQRMEIAALIPRVHLLLPDRFSIRFEADTRVSRST
jgi:hypothetical protein